MGWFIGSYVWKTHQIMPFNITPIKATVCSAAWTKLARLCCHGKVRRWFTIKHLEAESGGQATMNSMVKPRSLSTPAGTHRIHRATITSANLQSVP